MHYFWVVDYKVSAKGQLRPVIIGGRAFTTESAAQNYIDNSGLSSRAEIFDLDTSNQGKATGEIKAKLISRYKSLDQGMMRASHVK